jgi:hypothetical protein
MNPTKSKAPENNNNQDLPPGFILQEASDGTKFAVPRFLLPAAHSAFEAHKKKILFHIDDMESKVILFLFP